MLGGKKVKYGGQTGIPVNTDVHFTHPATGNKIRAGIVVRRDFTKLGPNEKENTYQVLDIETGKLFVVLQQHVTVSPVQQPILPKTPPSTPTASGRKRKTHKKKLRSKKRKTYTRR
jgi:hypothetical protein